MDRQSQRIGVLIPTRGLIFTKTIESLLNNLVDLDYKFYFTTDLPIPDCRNELAKQALKDKCTHLLWIDDDVIFPDNNRLTTMLFVDQPVVIMDYPTHFMGKMKDTGITAFEDWTEGMETEGKKVAWSGLGCCLVKAEVFDQLEYPYFRRGGHKFVRDDLGAITYYGEGEGDGGEDFEFFYDLKQKGIEPFLIRGKNCIHAKVLEYVGVVSQGKYKTCHTIHYADKISKPNK